MDEDDLDKLREKRKAQLIAAQKIKQARAKLPRFHCSYPPPFPRDPCNCNRAESTAANAQCAYKPNRLLFFF